MEGKQSRRVLQYSYPLTRTSTVYHAAGTASMGKVVDNDLKVLGIRGLRIVDASVIPVPIAAHYQALIYALGERAADIISSAHSVQLDEK